MRIVDIVFKAGILAALVAHLFLYSQDIRSGRYQGAPANGFVLDSQQGVMYIFRGANEPPLIFNVLTGKKMKPDLK